MGGKTSTESKTKYNAKTYDEIKVRVPKHKKERIQAFAALQGKRLNRHVAGCNTDWKCISMLFIDHFQKSASNSLLIPIMRESVSSINAF